MYDETVRKELSGWKEEAARMIEEYLAVVDECSGLTHVDDVTSGERVYIRPITLLLLGAWTSDALLKVAVRWRAGGGTFVPYSFQYCGFNTCNVEFLI